MATDIKKYLDQSGVSVLWTAVAEKVKEEADRAKAAEEANAAAAKAAQNDVDTLEAYVGTIPEGYETQTNIVAFIQKRAEEVLTQASGGSSESAASVLAALNTYKSENDPKVTKNTEDIAAIVADYLTSTDKTELEGKIKTNADEITRIDGVLKNAIENDGEGLDSIKELATWIENHGTEAAGYAAAIEALETLVGDTAVATQIANAIAAEHLEQYAKATDLETTNGNVTALQNKVDTTGTVTEAINAAINALAIGDYAKAADLTALAARVTANEGAIADLEAADIAFETRVKAIEDKTATWDAAEANAKSYADGLAKNYDAVGAADTALASAKTYTDDQISTRVIALTEAEIQAAINSAKSST